MSIAERSNHAESAIERLDEIGRAIRWEFWIAH